MIHGEEIGRKLCVTGDESDEKVIADVLGAAGGGFQGAITRFNSRQTMIPPAD